MLAKLLDGLPWPRTRLTPLLSILALVGLVEYTRTGLYTVYLPQQLGPLVGLGAVGLAATVQYLADTLSRSPGGHLSERYGIGRTLPLAALLAGISALGVIYAPSAFWLLLASFANGLFIAPLWPTFLTYSSRAANQGEDGRAIGVTFTLVAPFIGLGVLLTGFLYDRSPALAAASLATVQLLLIATGLLLVPRVFGGKRQLPRVSYQNFPWKRLLYLAPGALAQMLALGLLTPVLFPYLKQLGFGTAALTAALVVGGGVEVALISPLGRLVDRHGPNRTFVIALFLAAIALLAFSLVSGLPSLLLTAALAGALQALLIPSWGGFVSRSLPDEFKTSSWGALMTLEGLGFAIGPVIGGYSWQLFGSKAPFYAGALLYASVAVFYLLRLRRR